jgi:hypothetical protein
VEAVPGGEGGRVGGVIGSKGGGVDEVEFEFGGEVGSSGGGVEGGAHCDEVAVGQGAGSSGEEFDAVHERPMC